MGRPYRTLQGVSAFFAGVDEQLTRDCQRSEFALYAWTARRLRLGIDGICTNFRDRAAALLDGEGRA